MTNKDQVKALRESVVSMFIRMSNAHGYEELSVGDAETRDMVRQGLDDLMQGMQVDKTSWNYVKKNMLYDIYLESRKADGTITEYDLTRGGLTLAMFADPYEFYNHQSRRASSPKSDTGEHSKKCTECGQEKPLRSFKGAKCKSCLARAYRRRAADKNKEEDNGYE